MSEQMNNFLSPERLRPSSSPARGDEDNHFLSDYQRVVFSSSFRRLQDKTQVSPLASTDFVRRRLTHSVEVATIGERMGRVLAARLSGKQIPDIGGNLPDRFGKVIATACLLHDIGNPPFGHEGEVAIRQWAETLLGSFKSGIPDYRSFDGNAQGFRIIVRLHNHGMPYGANLTAATLGCMVKYPVRSSDSPAADVHKRGKYGFMRTEQHHFDRVRELCGLKAAQRHPLSFVMEAADDIVNRVVDLEDALKLGYVDYDEIRCALSKNDDEDGKQLLSILDKRYDDTADSRLTSRERRQLAYQHFRVEATARFAQSCEKAFVDNFEAIRAGGFSKELMAASDCYKTYKALKDLEYSRIFDNPAIVRVEAGGKVAVRGLLSIFFDEVKANGKLAKMVPEPPQYPGEELNQEVTQVQRVVDYVSGMTDRFAVDLYQQLSGMNL